MIVRSSVDLRDFPVSEALKLVLQFKLRASRISPATASPIRPAIPARFCRRPSPVSRRGRIEPGGRSPCGAIPHGLRLLRRAHVGELKCRVELVNHLAFVKPKLALGRLLAAQLAEEMAVTSHVQFATEWYSRIPPAVGARRESSWPSCVVRWRAKLHEGLVVRREAADHFDGCNESACAKASFGSCR